MMMRVVRCELAGKRGGKEAISVVQVRHSHNFVISINVITENISN